MNDFIEIYDNALPDEWCKNYINFFDINKNFQYNRNKLYGEKYRQTLVDDNAIDMLSDFQNLNLYSTMKPFMNFFWPCYEKYVEKYSILKNMARQNVYQLKIQKTEPSQGYHVWHAENMERNQQQRVAVLICYLNDIYEGGETEFLYQHKRIQPKKGRILIWPSSFTHTHRGNPPLNNSKYIITGWVEF